MRIFAASLATETNTFSPIPTSRASFEDAFYAPAGQHPDEPKLCTAPLLIARRRAKAEGFTLIEGSSFWAEPSGTVVRRDFESMRDEILDQLKAALPVDAVLMGFHGAFVAEGYDDVEGDMLERIRALVGPDCVIGCEYDPHCHLTEKRVRLANVSVLFKEYPHVDFMERGEEVVEMVLQTLRGKIKPVASLYDPRLYDFYPTTTEPMRSFVDRMKALEGRERRALDLDRPRLQPCRRAGYGLARARHYRWAQSGGRCAGKIHRRGNVRDARQMVPAVTAARWRHDASVRTQPRHGDHRGAVR